MSLPRLLSTREAAAALAVSPACLEAWRSRGSGGPAWRKIGRLVKYSEDDLAAFLAARTRGADGAGAASDHAQRA